MRTLAQFVTAPQCIWVWFGLLELFVQPSDSVKLAQLGKATRPLTSECRGAGYVTMTGLRWAHGFCTTVGSSNNLFFFCCALISAAVETSAIHSFIACVAKDTKHISCLRNIPNSSPLPSLTKWTGRLLFKLCGTVQPHKVLCSLRQWLHRAGRAEESGHCPWCDYVFGNWVRVAWSCDHKSPAVETSAALQACAFWPNYQLRLVFFGFFGDVFGRRPGFKPHGTCLSQFHQSRVQTHALWEMKQ